MHVHHLNCGSMCPRPAGLISSHGGGVGKAELVCHCLLIELRDGWALVDTGLGREDVAHARRRLGAGFMLLTSPRLDANEPAIAQLAKLGLHERDVRHILPTHLDVDHAGGIADFPHATVHLLAREHAAASTPQNFLERERYKPHQWQHATFKLHEPDGAHWFGFEGVRPLASSQDEVLIIPLYGHTRGHAGIAVRTGPGWLLHAGDAYFNHDEIRGGDAPLGLEAFQHMMQVDRRQRLHNRERLRELVRAHSDEVRVICAHDPDEFRSAPGPTPGARPVHA